MGSQIAESMYSQLAKRVIWLHTSLGILIICLMNFSSFAFLLVLTIAADELASFFVSYMQGMFIFYCTVFKCIESQSKLKCFKLK